MNGSSSTLSKLSAIGSHTFGVATLSSAPTIMFVLDQRLSTVLQHQWISKLFGFDFSVEYQPSRLNAVADALSRCEPDDLHLAIISTPTFQLFADLRNELREDDDLRRLRDTIAATRGAPW